MRSKSDWLDVGLTQLTRHGLRGLRLTELCDAIGATRGSFYHHFRDIAAYRADLAAHCEHVLATRYFEVARAVADQGPAAQVAAVKAAVYTEGLTEQELLLERAVRAWGTQEENARVVVERIDRDRTTFMAQLLDEMGVTDAAERATILNLILIGALYVIPQLSGERIRQLSDLVLADLAPPPVGGLSAP